MTAKYKLETVKVQVGFECDNCGATNPCDAVTLSMGFGSALDSSTYHFCGDACIAAIFRNPEFDWIDYLKMVDRRNEPDDWPF